MRSNAELRATRIDWDWAAIVEEADAVRRAAEPGAPASEIPRCSRRRIAFCPRNVRQRRAPHPDPRPLAVEADVPLARARMAAFEDEALHVVSAAAIAGQGAVRSGCTTIACYHALSGSPDIARSLLRDAFRGPGAGRATAGPTSELLSIRGDIDDLSRLIHPARRSLQRRVLAPPRRRHRGDHGLTVRGRRRS